MKQENIITYELDLENPKPLTAAERAQIKALAALSDDQIDTSDIPPTPEKFLRNAVRNPFYPRTKR